MHFVNRKLLYFDKNEIMYLWVQIDKNVSFDSGKNILSSCKTDNVNSYNTWILSLRPANGRRRYKVTPSLIGCAQT